MRSPRLGAVLILLSSLPVVAADARFAAYLAQFKPGTFPFPASAPAAKATLSAEDATAFVLDPALKSSAPALQSLRDAWGPLHHDETRELLQGKPLEYLTVFAFAPVAVFHRKGHELVAVRLDVEAAMYVQHQTYLLSYSPAGALLDGALLDDYISGEGGSFAEDVSFTAEGVITRKRTGLYPIMELGPPRELTVHSEITTQLRPNGTFAAPRERFLDPAGRFIERQSKEELELFLGADGLRVFYRATDSAPWQELTVSGDASKGELAVKFSASTKPYALTFDPARLTLTCKNPDGHVQRFTRER